MPDPQPNWSSFKGFDSNFPTNSPPTPHTLTLLSVSLKLQQLMKYSAALTKKKM